MALSAPISAKDKRTPKQLQYIEITNFQMANKINNENEDKDAEKKIINVSKQKIKNQL